MKTMNPYLNFQPGKTREALNFYKDALKGEIVSIQTFADAKLDAPPQFRNNIIHAVFQAEGIRFMASDGQPGSEVKRGDNAYLCIDFTDAKEQEAVWKALGAGGIVAMPLEDTFWGARFGIVIDRYGINWMLNCGKQG